MKLPIEIQYAHFHPDQVKSVGSGDFEQALKIIQSFPWEKEFEKIERRDLQGQTSTVPNVAIKNARKETLIISARDTANFIVEVLTPTHRGERMISNNSFANNNRLVVEECLARFYSGTINQIIGLTPHHLPVSNTHTYTLRAFPQFACGLGLGLFLLIFLFNVFYNGFSSKALPTYYFLGLIIIMFGLSALVSLQYLINEWDKEITVDRDGILIRQKKKINYIRKNEIDQFVIIENKNHRNLKHFSYTRIKTNNDQVFIITSFIIEPLTLADQLRINHKEESVFLPTIDYAIQSEKEKKKESRVREKKKAEILLKFKNYEDKKLRQIIQDSNSYNDYAIEAAREVLANRK